MYENFTLPRNQQPWRFLGDDGPKSIKQLEIEGILNGYGILFPRFIAELKELASGRLHRDLCSSNNFQPGDAVKKYWHVFTTAFPCISDSLVINFQYVLYASTLAEQLFTVATSVSVANVSRQTFNRKLMHHFNIRGSIIRLSEL
jgi:hypothetical protein